MKTLPSLRVHFSIALFCLAMLFWGHGIWIYAKAKLAQYLIETSWQTSLIQGADIKPWRWADTWPVAKLTFTQQHRVFYVLAGDNGSALAFGPGLSAGTGLTKVIHGHRDTHFSALQDLQVGEQLEIQDRSGVTSVYRVKEALIADIETGPWLVNPDKDELHLITCYPFDSLDSGGPLRWVVIAEKVDTQILEPTLATTSSSKTK